MNIKADQIEDDEDEIESSLEEEIDFELIDDLNTNDDDEDDGSAGAPPTIAKKATVQKKEDEIPFNDVDEEKERLRDEAVALKEENARFAKERQEALEEKYTTKKMMLEESIQTYSGRMEAERVTLTDLHKQLEIARAEQDGQKAADLTGKISDKANAYQDLNNRLSNAQYQLNNLAPVAKEEPAKKVESAKADPFAPAKERANKWAAVNSWYEDPKFSDKRDKADSLYKELVDKKYDPSKEIFWNHIDQRLADFEKEPEVRRSAPPVRPIVNGNLGANKMSQKKKPDAEVLSHLKKFMELRGVNEQNTKPDRLKQMKQEAYKSIERTLAKAKQNATA